MTTSFTRRPRETRAGERWSLAGQALPLYQELLEAAGRLQATLGQLAHRFRLRNMLEAPLGHDHGVLEALLDPQSIEVRAPSLPAHRRLESLHPERHVDGPLLLERVVTGGDVEPRVAFLGQVHDVDVVHVEVGVARLEPGAFEPIDVDEGVADGRSRGRCVDGAGGHTPGQEHDAGDDGGPPHDDRTRSMSGPSVARRASSDGPAGSTRRVVMPLAR